MIIISNLLLKFNSSFSLKILDLKIKPSESILIVGANGSGKTSLLKTILDMHKVKEGTVLSFNHKVKATETWKKYTGAYLDTSFLIPFLTPYEYLKVISEWRGIEKLQLDEFVKSHKTFLDVKNISQKINNLSRGNQAKSGILGAFLGATKVLILDEPLANLDILSQEYLLNEFRYNMKDRIILITSHQLNNDFSMFNRIISLKGGEINMDEPYSQNTLDLASKNTINAENI